MGAAMNRLSKVVYSMNCGGVNALFNQLSNEVKAADHDISEACKHFIQFTGKEFFGANSYRLEITLPLYAGGQFQVIAKHRVVYVSGHVPQVYDCDLTYGDIRILPNIVDTGRGMYTYKDQKLIIAFPYNDAINGQVFNGGSQYIDSTPRTIGMGSPYDILFSD